MVRSCNWSWCARFFDVHESALNFALLVFGYILFVFIGAGIFSAIELPYEVELRQELKEARENFLSENSCVSDARLGELLTRVLEASNYGVSMMENDTDLNWDFVSSLFFTSTMLTTTGYGYSVPLSDQGKAFCIFYTLLGVPATLFVLSVVVQNLMVVLSRRPLSYFHRRWAVPKGNLATAHATCLTLVMILLFLIVPAIIFVNLERDWTFLDSLYFCFMSLTTIGLGDYVPGETHSREDNPHPQLYRMAIILYLLVGLVAVLLVMETCYELPQMRRFRQRFYKESVRELDSETANIIDRDHISEEVNELPHQELPPAISIVLEEAASIREDGISAPYTLTSSSDVGQKER